MKKYFSVLLLWTLFAPPLIAAGLEVEGVFPELVFEDQHENEAAFPADTAIIIFAAEKAGADLVNTYLGNQPLDFLSTHKARFISDISAMPSMITRMFALPKMRDYPYPVYLVRNAESASFVPRQKGHVTVMSLSDGRVTDILYVSTEAELATVFNHSTTSQ